MRQPQVSTRSIPSCPGSSSWLPSSRSASASGHWFAPRRARCLGRGAVNAAAVAGWLATRMFGISWIDGLEVREAPQFADTACAALGLLAIVAANAGALLPAEKQRRTWLIAPTVLICAATVWTMMAASTHVHSHTGGDHATEAAGAEHVTSGTTTARGRGRRCGGCVGRDRRLRRACARRCPRNDRGSDHRRSPPRRHGSTGRPGLASPMGSDRADRPLRRGGRQRRAGTPGRHTDRRHAARAAEVRRPADAVAAGYASIGDAGTGTEHYIKSDLIEDDVLLDPTAPESLVYAVNGDERTLAGAMYIASARPADDPSLTDWAGPLMTWHKHDNLCWDRCRRRGQGGRRHRRQRQLRQRRPRRRREPDGARLDHPAPVRRVRRARGHRRRHGSGVGGRARRHVQRRPRPRRRQRQRPVAPKPYDPTQPIDLSGTPGVTPEQQAAAENLIAITLVRLPQWSDYKVAEAAGFRSIGDAGTGHEHFIQWDWINDDVILDPDRPESLVYEPQPDGSKKLVSAMYMLPDDVALDRRARHRRRPDAVAHPRQPLLHERPGAAPCRRADEPRGSCPHGLVKFAIRLR